MKLLIFIVLCVIAMPIPAAQQTIYRLQENETQVITMAGKIDRVVVSAPSICDVHALSSHELLLSGRRRGKVTLMVRTEDGERHSLQVEVGGRRAASTSPYSRRQQAIKAILAELDPAGRVRASWQGKRLVLSGTVADEAQRERIVASCREQGSPPLDLMQLDHTPQVRLLVQVAEVIKSNPLRSGVSMLDKRDRLGLFTPGSLGSSANFLLELGSVTPGTAATLPVAHNDAFQVTVNPSNSSLFGVLSLLEGHQLARVLAQPTLVVESGKTASFLAGGEVPIPIAQEDNTISVDYKEFGVMLEFTPQVEGEVIALQVSPEVSSIDQTAGIQLGSIVIPGFRTRRTETSVRLRDGESFVIGGLLQDEMRSVVNKVPLLGDIPILGALFRSSAYESDQSELAVVVTAHLVKPLAAGTQLELPGVDMARPSTSDALLFGRLSERRTDASQSYPPELLGLAQPQEAP